MNLHWIDGVWAVFLVAVVPYVALLTFRRFQGALASGAPRARVEAYRRTILGQWLAAGAALATWLVLGRDLAALGLGGPARPGFWWGGAATLVASALLVVQMRSVVADARKLAAARAKFEPVRALLPADDREARWFDALGLTAGICEEVVYRGYLLAVLAALVGTVGAVALSALVFGLAHAYQGVRGVAGTALAGAVAAALVVWTGALWAPMLLHAVVDWTSGRIGRHALAPPPSVD